VPGGEGTKHVIGSKELAMMKPTAFILNCSRGGVVDEAALGEAVKSGTIGGAGLDVYEIEPAATDKEFKDPIVQVPNVYGTHHVGASTEQAQNAVADEVVRIVRRRIETGEFINCVNRK
jgi:D-3-phosphoglycerate dehydrogenase